MVMNKNTLPFYEYKDCSAVLVERKENDGTVDEIFTLDITYMSGQPESDLFLPLYFHCRCP